uniref:Protein ENL-like n=1 Tax=Nicotiana tabacum TaxID=4097 RepID=A0A1S3XWJ1_TOBAC|nr:PREDICTED: protein ENL-like [Nicotiana tabacum]
MSNPQENPGTPPPPSPSNSSSSTPPSVSPKPRLLRVKMLARKTVSSGALRKALNERLKASQVKESQAPNSNSSSESESYQSATEGEGHEFFDSEKIQESPSEVSSSVIENLETRFVLVGPIRDVEVLEKRRSGAAEGLVHLSTQRDDPVSSTEETLTDLLKKVGASYDPKKRRTPTTETPNIPKPSKKKKASSPTPTTSSLPRGRATRSRVT